MHNHDKWGDLSSESEATIEQLRKMSKEVKHHFMLMALNNIRNTENKEQVDNVIWMLETK